MVVNIHRQTSSLVLNMHTFILLLIMLGRPQSMDINDVRVTCRRCWRRCPNDHGMPLCLSRLRQPAEYCPFCGSIVQIGESHPACVWCIYNPNLIVDGLGNVISSNAKRTRPCDATPSDDDDNKTDNKRAKKQKSTASSSKDEPANC